MIQQITVIFNKENSDLNNSIMSSAQSATENQRRGRSVTPKPKVDKKLVQPQTQRPSPLNPSVLSTMPEQLDISLTRTSDSAYKPATQLIKPTSEQQIQTGTTIQTTTTPSQVDVNPTNEELQAQITAMQSMMVSLVASQQQTAQLLGTMLAQQASMAHPATTTIQPTLSSNVTVTTNSEVQTPGDQPMVTPHGIFRRMQMPRISKIQPENSFVQLECWLAYNNIITDEDKFGVLQLAIEPDTTAHMLTIINNPPATNRYPALKKAIIKLYAESQVSKMRKLLLQTSYSSSKPSIVLSEMRQFCPEGSNTEIFKSLFLERLPAHIRNSINSLKLLVPNAEQLTLDQIAEYGDQQLDSGEQHSVHTVRANTIDEFLEQIIERVCKKFITKGQRSRSNSRSHDHRKNTPLTHVKPVERPSSSFDEAQQNASGPKPCYFHEKYGNGRHENKKCYPGCQLHKEWLQATKN